MYSVLRTGRSYEQYFDEDKGTTHQGFAEADPVYVKTGQNRLSGDAKHSLQS
jgi:hypothetical protein